MAVPNWPKFRDDLFEWGFFCVVASVLPLLLTYAERWVNRQSHDPVQIIANGELVLVSAVLAAGSVGALLNRERKSKVPKNEQLLIFGALASLFGGGWFYSTLSRNAQTNAGDTAFSAWLSGAAFGLMVVVGICTTYMMCLED